MYLYQFWVKVHLGGQGKTSNLPPSDPVESDTLVNKKSEIRFLHKKNSCVSVICSDDWGIWISCVDVILEFRLEKADNNQVTEESVNTQKASRMKFSTVISFSEEKHILFSFDRQTGLRQTLVRKLCRSANTKWPLNCWRLTVMTSCLLPLFSHFCPSFFVRACDAHHSETTWGHASFAFIGPLVFNGSVTQRSHKLAFKYGWRCNTQRC